MVPDFFEHFSEITIIFRYDPKIKIGNEKVEFYKIAPNDLKLSRVVQKSFAHIFLKYIIGFDNFRESYRISKFSNSTIFAVIVPKNL